MSAPRPLDFLRGRGTISLDLGLVFGVAALRRDNSGKLSVLEGIVKGVK